MPNTSPTDLDEAARPLGRALTRSCSVCWSSTSMKASSAEPKMRLIGAAGWIRQISCNWPKQSAWMCVSSVRNPWACWVSPARRALCPS